MRLSSMSVTAACTGFLTLSALTIPVHAADPLASRTGFFFDTVTTISLYDTDDESILDACFDQMQYYESLLSRTMEGSDVWNINHSHCEPVTVSPETVSLIEKALSYCELTDGSFDITIAPVVDLWDFHDDTDVHVLPDPDALSEALTHVDYHNIQIDQSTVTLTDPDTRIDLGAIAKGYISDQLKQTILQHGSQCALINLGGNVVAVGSKMDGSSWNIGIRKPFGETTSDLAAVVPAKNQSVITSGTYERYFILDDTLYHHILSPRNGYPVMNELCSVSILNEDATDGDALSTVSFLLGLEKAYALIESLENTDALFITNDEKQYATSGWPN